ncbi:hypothetical protein ACHWQZ_G019321 [Mnemiopsis leidyi]
MNKKSTDPKYLRWSMYFFNSLYFFVAVTLWTLAIWTVYSMRYLAIVDEHYSYFVAIFMATTGTLIFSASVFACCGAFWENKAVLYVFIGIMWLILILEIALSIWIFYNLEPIKRSVRPMMFDLLETYEDTQGSMVVDKIQYNFECCGVDSHLDWIHTQWGQENLGLLPGSCCHNMFRTCNVSTTTFAQTVRTCFARAMLALQPSHKQ